MGVRTTKIATKVADNTSQGVTKVPLPGVYKNATVQIGKGGRLEDAVEGGSSQRIRELLDVSALDPVDGDTLVYNSETGMYETAQVTGLTHPKVMKRINIGL